MNQQDDLINPTPDPDGDNPLEFWVAYIPGEGEKKNYLSDGKGNLRVFKNEAALREYLKPNLSPEVYEMVVVHPVQGKIALPDDGTLSQPEGPALPQEFVQRGKEPLIPLEMLKMKPITTLALPTVPSAYEQLEHFKERARKRRRRNK